MNTAKKLTGLALATAAAGLFAMAPMTASAAQHEGKMECQGVNACKGKSDCKTAASACKGLNACKGKGMMIMSKKDCDTAKAHEAEMKKQGK
ncbi:MAG: hypothetical protein A2V91_03415 [Candidatus Muproteobacteria bacterium RBG_16_64_10]|uniref:Silver efflux pump n=1 Tax=Candidatus Muproteobacteria bacterium RBG_16_64_10 TaxID=1817757 RepID=A0A1F6T6W4_9PROT|nr:MAG: hypothetical protein A2V91_03415 [Candidatus Muproteobacteria bacterium RBG_16_64_10]